MPITLEGKKSPKLNVHLEKFKAKVPRLNVKNGVAEIDGDNPMQRKWFEAFKK